MSSGAFPIGDMLLESTSVFAEKWGSQSQSETASSLGFWNACAWTLRRKQARAATIRARTATIIPTKIATLKTEAIVTPSDPEALPL
jgi:hypothetical protein